MRLLLPSIHRANVWMKQSGSQCCKTLKCTANITVTWWLLSSRKLQTFRQYKSHFIALSITWSLQRCVWSHSKKQRWMNLLNNVQETQPDLCWCTYNFVVLADIYCYLKLYRSNFYLPREKKKRLTVKNPYHRADPRGSEWVKLSPTSGGCWGVFT